MVEKLIEFLKALEKKERSELQINGRTITIEGIEQAPKKEQEFIYVLDAGHGGIDPKTGLYTTAPAKMYKHKDFTFYEGVYNRLISEKVERKLKERGLKYVLTFQGCKDTPLQDRVKIVNELVRKRSKCVLFSIHGNAASSEKATGVEHFTSRGKTLSDAIAERMYKASKEMLPELPLRTDKSDGDSDKEAGFYMLRKTHCAAVLSEFGFFTNPSEARLMLTDEFQERCAEVIIDSVDWLERGMKG